MADGDDGVRGFTLSAICTPVHSLDGYATHPTAFVASDGCHVGISKNIRMGRMAGPLVGNV